MPLSLNGTDLFGFDIIQQNQLKKMIVFLEAATAGGATSFPYIPQTMFFGFDNEQTYLLTSALYWAWNNPSTLQPLSQSILRNAFNPEQVEAITKLARVMTDAGVGGAGPLSVPAGLGWTPPINVYRSSAGVYSTNYDPSPILVEGDPGVTTYYVDADTGNESNPGTAALPKASLRTITSAGGSGAKLLVKARGKFYYGVTGTAFNYAGIQQVESWGGAECRITTETHPSLYPWVWTDETGGVWSSPIPNTWFGYTTVIASTNPESTAVYPQAASLAECQATAGTVFYVAGTPNKYYVHTAAGTSPATGHILAGGGGNACETTGRGYDQRIMYRGVTFLGGDAAFAVAGVVGATSRRQDFIGCKFLHARTAAAFSVLGDSQVYTYQCIAGPSKFDGFAYTPDGAAAGRFVEIECIGRYAGYSAGPNQGSTIHGGCKILRVNGQYYGNRDQQIADVNANTASWNLGCTVGPEKVAGSYGFYCGNDGGNTQMYLDGCVTTGMTYQMHAYTGAHIWYTNMAAPTTGTITTTGIISDYSGVAVSPYVPPAAAQPSITAINANFTVADSPVTGWKRITKVGGTNGTLERAAETTQLQPNWAVFIRDPSELAYYMGGVSKLAGPYGITGIYGTGPNGSGNATILYYAAGVYGGSSQPRQTGISYGTSRNTGGAADGYPGHFNGDVSTVADMVTAYGMGATEAGTPAIFDCMIAGIGQYIDVKIT